MSFKPGRGLLGPLKPLLGDWRREGEHNGGPGFRFAVESRTKKGWNRFLLHEYRPA